MNEQTTLNAEQEAFLDYQAASEAHKQYCIKENAIWDKYMRLGWEANAAFNEWKEFSQNRSSLVDAEFNTLNKWREVRGY